MSSRTVAGEETDGKFGEPRKVECPTSEFDLGLTPRFNPTNTLNLVSRSLARYVGQTEADRLFKLEAENSRNWAATNRPGFTLLDRALSDASHTVAKASAPNQGIFSWTQAAGSGLPTHQALGIPPCAASIEEAASAVKTAARFFGAALVGISSLRKEWVYTHCRGKPVDFGDTDFPKETDERFIIPERCKWVVSCAVEMSRVSLDRAPSVIADAAAKQAYSRLAFVVASLAQFIRGLGYVAIPDRADIVLGVPFGIAAGLGELGRLNYLVTPDYGPQVRIYSVITDLPLAEDKPVDFGLQEFCRHCRKCAEACPAKAISFEEEPSWEPKGPWNNSGKRAWFLDAPRCYSYLRKITTNCGLCLRACPWPSHLKGEAELSSGTGVEMETEWWKIPHSPFGL